MQICVCAYIHITSQTHDTYMQMLLKLIVTS